MRFLPKLGSKALPIYFVCGIIIIGIITFFYSNRFVSQLSLEAEKTSKLFAQFIQNPTKSNEEISDLIFREVIQKIEFPVVLTDTGGTPISWRNIGSDDQTKEEVAKVIKQLDQENEPIPIKVTTNGDSLIVNYVHYGLSPFARTLKLIPFILTALLSVFLLVGLWGYLQHRKSVEESIWASMAKETAHQLATPVSSIVGWLDALRGEVDEKYTQAMEEDINRMKDVLEKFSRIGSEPKLDLEDPVKIAKSTVNYMKHKAHKKVAIIEQYESTGKIKTDPVLMRWAMENLIKNSLDAIGAKQGRIVIATSDQGEYIKISVTDNGGGIKDSNKIFEPGYSTKKYGWGLGLVLTKRIVEEYHNGRIQLEASSPQQTTISIIIPRGD